MSRSKDAASVYFQAVRILPSFALHLRCSLYACTRQDQDKCDMRNVSGTVPLPLMYSIPCLWVWSIIVIVIVVVFTKILTTAFFSEIFLWYLALKCHRGSYKNVLRQMKSDCLHLPQIDKRKCPPRKPSLRRKRGISKLGAGFNYTVITTSILLDDTSDVRVSSGRRWVQLLFSKSLFTCDSFVWDVIINVVSYLISCR